MIPILFAASTTDFSTNGLGRLAEATACTVTEVLNGELELYMQYPVSGMLYKGIVHSAIILADPGDGRSAQAFQIYKITKPINGIITINAEHISYQLTKIPVSPFSASNITSALSGLKSNAAAACPFEFWTDKTSGAYFSVDVPSSIRSSLGGREGSILDVYGGEYEFDNYLIKLYGQRGRDSGVKLAYGKNITDLSQEENIANAITGVYPYWQGNDSYVELPEKTVLSTASANYPYPRITPLDCSQEWEQKPTVAQLRTYATSYVSRSGIGIPVVSIKVSFVALWQTEEYKDIAPLERVQLADRVTVEFEKLGVSATAKVVKTVYNVLLDRYDSIELGETRTNLSKDIIAQNQAIKDKPSKTFLQQAVDSATDWITGADGGYVVLHRDANKQPYEILIMNTADIATATKVWRWNQGGLGYSSSGYNGPYATAITQNGAIVADFITAGTMLANRIQGGTLTLGGQNNGNGMATILDANGSQCVRLDKAGLNAIKGMIAGWVINQSAIYKDVTAPDGTIYRVYFQPPIASSPNNTWVLSCQKSTDGGKTFKGSFILFSDGSAQFGNRRISADGSEYVSSTNTYGDNIVMEYSVAFSELTLINKTQGAYSRISAQSFGCGKYSEGSGGSRTFSPKLYLNENGMVSGDYIYDTTTTASPNVYVEPNGVLKRSASSSKRYKTDVTERINPVLDPSKLYDVPVKQFKYKRGYLEKSDPKNGVDTIGFIVEDMLDVYPAAVMCDKDGRPEMWNVNVLVPAMLKLIQEQKKQIENLEKTVYKEGV